MHCTQTGTCRPWPVRPPESFQEPSRRLKSSQIQAGPYICRPLELFLEHAQASIIHGVVMASAVHFIPAIKLTSPATLPSSYLGCVVCVCVTWKGILSTTVSGETFVGWPWSILSQATLTSASTPSPIAMSTKCRKTSCSTICATTWWHSCTKEGGRREGKGAGWGMERDAGRRTEWCICVPVGRATCNMGRATWVGGQRG